MGASAFVHTVRGKSAHEGYEKLVNAANREYGAGGYNGSINTCSFGNCKQRYDTPSEKTKESAYSYIKAVGNGDKWVADYIDLGVCEYQVVTMKRVNTHGEPAVIRVKYVVREQVIQGLGKFIKSFDTKKEADNHSLALAVKNNQPYDVYKEGVVVSGEPKMSSIVLEVKSYNSKPNLKAMPNRYIVEIHEYIFYGFGSC